MQKSNTQSLAATSHRGSFEQPSSTPTENSPRQIGSTSESSREARVVTSLQKLNATLVKMTDQVDGLPRDFDRLISGMGKCDLRVYVSHLPDTFYCSLSQCKYITDSIKELARRTY